MVMIALLWILGTPGVLVTGGYEVVALLGDKQVIGVEECFWPAIDWCCA